MGQSRKGKRKQRRGRVASSTAQRLASKAADERVHLRVVADANTRRPSALLSRPLFEQAWQNELAQSAANTALSTLAGELSEQAVVALARHAMDATSRLADGLIARASNAKVACRSGCDHCCYQSVGVTPPEALAIVAHLLATRSAAALTELIRQLGEARERTHGLTPDERFTPEHPCPFLEAHRCSIYEVRPLSCRGMNSLDRVRCETTLRDPEARAAFLASGEGIESFLEPVRAFHAVSAGLQLAMAELFALDMRPLDLTAAVHELLQDASQRPTIVERWLRGEAPLEAARGGDASNRPGVDVLSGRVR